MAVETSPWKWHVSFPHDSLIKASYIGKNDGSVVGKYNFPQGWELKVILLVSYYCYNKLPQFIVL